MRLGPGHQHGRPGRNFWLPGSACSSPRLLRTFRSERSKQNQLSLTHTLPLPSLPFKSFITVKPLCVILKVKPKKRQCLILWQLAIIMLPEGKAHIFKSHIKVLSFSWKSFHTTNINYLERALENCLLTCSCNCLLYLFQEKEVQITYFAFLLHLHVCLGKGKGQMQPQWPMISHAPAWALPKFQRKSLTHQRNLNLSNHSNSKCLLMNKRNAKDDRMSAVSKM